MFRTTIHESFLGLRKLSSSSSFSSSSSNQLDWPPLLVPALRSLHCNSQNCSQAANDLTANECEWTLIKKFAFIGVNSRLNCRLGCDSARLRRAALIASLRFNWLRDWVVALPRWVLCGWLIMALPHFVYFVVLYLVFSVLIFLPQIFLPGIRVH